MINMATRVALVGGSAFLLAVATPSAASAESPVASADNTVHPMATCDFKNHEITVPGGEVAYWCADGEVHGVVNDTRADGKCAYVDVWGAGVSLRTYKACGWGNGTYWDRSGQALRSDWHVRLRTA
jgi:hypothetical protein